MNRFIIITAVSFLACKNQIQLVILEFGDLGHPTEVLALYSLCKCRSIKVNNNRVICQMSMKLLAMLDQNPPHIFDKIVKKLVQQETLSKLDLDPKCQGHNRNQKLITLGTKKHATPKKFEQGVP